MIKNTDEQPDKEVHRVMSGRVPSAGASVPVELGCVTRSVRGLFTNLEAHTTGIFLEASSRRRDQLLSPFPAPLPSLKDGGRG